MPADRPAEAAPDQGRGIFNLDWYRTLRGNARHAFWASALGWALDAFDFMVFSFALSAISATFALSKGEAGLIATATLVVSAFGGVLAGVLADRIGRVKTLMLTVAIYSIFTFLSGLAQSYEQLLVFRSLQGLGFGGEWAAGAILVAEIADPAQRGRVLGAIQSAWAIGWGNICYCLYYRIQPGRTGDWLAYALLARYSAGFAYPLRACLRSRAGGLSGDPESA